MKEKCTALTFLNVGGPARGEQETSSWSRESWRRYYAREETIGRSTTTIGRAEKTDRGKSEERRSES